MADDGCCTCEESPALNLTIRDLANEDKGYAISSWRESHKQAPGVDKIPWSFYKREYGAMISRLVDDPTTSLIGAYVGDKLAGWLALTYGKRVNTVHWAHTKFALDGQRLRRHGVMTALLDAADAGTPFVYTMRGAKRRITLPDGSKTKSLDEALVAWLRSRGQVATFVPLQEWLK